MVLFPPILREAGGAFTDWSGQCRIETGNGLSVNAALKEPVLQLLREAEKRAE